MNNPDFGWDYTPGCSGPPDEPDYCEICGGNIDDNSCICPECPVCGLYGDPGCYGEDGHGLKLSEEQETKKANFDSYEPGVDPYRDDYVNDEPEDE